MRKPFLALFVVVLALTGTTGCIFSPDEDPPDPPAPIPVNDTPENTIKRFIHTYENKMGTEYEALFTEDFTFEFSNSADPTLAQKYASGWFKEDERISARNLFQGFTDGSGTFQPPASSIDINLAPSVPQPDPGSGDQTRFYTLLTTVDASIVVPVNPSDPTNYLIDNNSHRYFLVRGDAAELGPGQPADSTRWYIYRWRDETATISATNPGVRLASSGSSRTGDEVPTTLGRVKAERR